VVSRHCLRNQPFWRDFFPWSHGTSIDSPRYCEGLPWPIILRLAGGHPLWPFQGGHLQGGSLGHFTTCLGYPISCGPITNDIGVHMHMARGGHGLPKVSPGPAMPYPSTPWGRATPEMNLRLFLGWLTRRASGLRPSSTPLDTPRRTPMLESTLNFYSFWPFVVFFLLQFVGVAEFELRDVDTLHRGRLASGICQRK
jgi:hypothetical protein